MKKDSNDVIFTLLDLEDTISRTVPAYAMVEISNMIYQAGIKRIDIALNNYEAVILDDESPEAIELNHSDEKMILDLSYDIKVYRRLGVRQAVAKTKLLFKGDDTSIYRITLENTMKVNTLAKDYDDMMFSSCYQYAKEIIEYLPLDMYTSTEIKLPNSYDDFCEVNKSYYDGYSFEMVLNSSHNEPSENVEDELTTTAEEGIETK